MKIDKRKLEIAMANKCFSGKELSRRTGIAESTIARIRRGDSISTKTIGTIAKALDVDVTEIIIDEAAATANDENK